MIEKQRQPRNHEGTKTHEEEKQMVFFVFSSQLRVFVVAFHGSARENVPNAAARYPTTDDLSPETSPESA